MSVVLEAPSDLGDEQRRRAQEACGHIAAWWQWLRLSPDARFTVAIDDDPGSALLWIDTTSAPYMIYRVGLSERWLSSHYDERRRTDVLHEVLHTVLAPIRAQAMSLLRVAATLDEQQARAADEAIAAAEERAITVLENAFAKGGGRGK